MAAIIKPADINKIWSASGDVLAPSDTKIAQGWGVEIPPRQYFNYIDGRQDQAIAHINQYGIAVWDSVTQYQYTANGPKSLAMGSDGVVYQAVQTSTNQDPTTDTTDAYWTPAYTSATNTYTKAQTDAKILDTIPHTLVTLSGTGNFTVPANVNRLEVFVWSGGGGGGGVGATGGIGGGGGAGGSYAQKILSVTPGQSIAYVVGGAGAAGGAGGNGGTGGTSSFGSAISVTGGVGGIAGGAANGNGGSPGAGTGGDLNFVGGAGGQGISTLGGLGGNAAIGGSGSQAGSGVSSPGGFPGGGGAGRGPVSVGAGGAGGAGNIVVRY